MLNETYTVRALGKIHHVNLAKDEKYTFEFDRAISRYGCCKYSSNTITMSKAMAERNLHIWPELREIMLHEIAHGVSFKIHGGAGAGHNSLWKDIALQIGSDGSRCQNILKFNVPVSKYQLICDKCGMIFPRARKPRKGAIYSCSICSPRYDPEYALKLVQDMRNVHKWTKASLVTEKGGYDRMVCELCGAKGKRHGLGSITADKRYDQKFCKK